MKVYEHTCDGCRMFVRKSYDGIPPGWWKITTTKGSANGPSVQRRENADVDHACSRECVRIVLDELVTKLAGYAFTVDVEYCK